MSKKRNQYTGNCRYEPGDAVWLAHVDEIPEVHAYGHTLLQAEAHLREALALWLEVGEEELQIVPRRGLDVNALDPAGAPDELTDEEAMSLALEAQKWARDRRA